MSCHSDRGAHPQQQRCRALQNNVFARNKESPHLAIEKIKSEYAAQREGVKWGFPLLSLYARFQSHTTRGSEIERDS